MSSSIDEFGEEYRRVMTDAGALEGGLGLFWAVGEDSVGFLQGILSQEIVGLNPGESARSFLLEPRGKLNSLIWVLRGTDRVGIVTDGVLRDQVMRSLSRWMLRVKVELVPDPRPVFDVWGPGGGLPDIDSGWSDSDGLLVGELRRSPIRRRLVAGVTASELEARGVFPIRSGTVDILRVECGEPLMEVDVNEKTIPQETGLVPEAVSFSKGCYLGQELVARIDTRGRVNRHLRGLRFIGKVKPPVGGSVNHEGKVVGTLTTVAESPSWGAQIALSLIRREVEPGTLVTVSWEGDQAEAEVHELPMGMGTS